MGREEYRGLLKAASEQVPFGIYAIERPDYAELLCDNCTSMTQLKARRRQYKTAGYKVYANE